MKKLIFAVSLSVALVFSSGVGLGYFAGKSLSVCPPVQAGERLISTHQNNSEVLCVYGQGYGRAKRLALATKE